MSDYKDDAFGGLWDLGEVVAPDAITYPIRRLIRRDAEKAGIDMRNPVRSVAQIIASGLMGATLLPFLGPFGALAGGLLGYTIATGASYPGDKSRSQRESEDEAWYALKLKAVSIAVEAAKAHTTDRTWSAIQNEVFSTIDYIQETNPDARSLRHACSIMLDPVFNSIRRVDGNVYREFINVFQAAERELGL